MSLEAFNSNTSLPPYFAGTVLFNTGMPDEDLPHSYHAMIVREGTSKTSPEGTISIPVCEMTLDGIDMEGHCELDENCYFGFLPTAGKASREAVEALSSVITSPSAAGDPQFYSLATHGIRKDDPNSPGEFLSEIHCSCASLVEWCYEQIGEGIDLVDQAHLPCRSMEELWQTFVVPAKPYLPHVAARLLRRWGLSGGGPWPVLLPAYQMHAFDKGIYPYEASMGDHPFAREVSSETTEKPT